MNELKYDKACFKDTETNSHISRMKIEDFEKGKREHLELVKLEMYLGTLDTKKYTEGLLDG